MSDEQDRFHLPIHQEYPEGDTPVDARDAVQPPGRGFLRPPGGAPNILIVLIDDMGYATSETYGGPARMPSIDRVAEDGAVFTRFHTTALCSPTRQALMTGRNHHTAEMGALAEAATSHRGYSGMRPDDCATFPQMLSMNGYATAAFGKWHQTPPWESSPAGPFNHWPIHEGFDKFYGFLGADANQLRPALYDGLSPINPPKTPEEGYHLTEDLVDQALTWIGYQHAITPDRPWFTYLSFGALHAPHHVPQEWMDGVRGKFDEGYDVLREQILARQKEAGILPEDTDLTAQNKYIPAWDDLDEDSQRLGARLFEAYVAMAEHTDHHVTRLFDQLEDWGVLDDTLIFYMLGDNGSSAEAGPYGTTNELAYQNDVMLTTDQMIGQIDEIGGEGVWSNLSAGYAQAMNTPYQWSKVIASHWGGTRNGLVVRWPEKIKPGLRHQFCYVTDIAPTCLAAAGVPFPTRVRGVEQTPFEGMDLGYTFENLEAPEVHETQYFEMGGNRAIYHRGWSAVTQHVYPLPNADPVPPFPDDVWELYAPDDWSQAHDLAADEPAKLRELQDRFLIEASKYHVFPLDDRTHERFDAKIAGRPSIMGDRTSMTLRPGMGRLNENTVPNVKNTSFEVIADVTVDDNAEGAIIAQGGSFGGWTLYLKQGRPVYAHNYLALDTYVAEATDAVEAGDHEIRLRFAYDGGGAGKGGTATLLVDGAEVGSGRVERTIPSLFSFDDWLDVGEDSGEPVVRDYAERGAPFRGTIHKVTIDVAPDAENDAELDYRRHLRKN